MGLTLGVIGIVLAVALIVVAIGMQLDERADIRTSLRRVGGYEVQDTRDRELLESLSERTFLPAIRSVGDFGRRVSPVGYLDSVKAKLLRSGQAERSDLDRFIVLKIAGVVLAPIAVFVILVVLNIEGLMGLLLAGVAAASLALGPDIVLDRKVERRVKAMRVALPEILDLLVISVEAGLGFEQALDRVVDNVPGPLTDEFARMLGEVRAGASRSEAMRAMEQRVDVQEVRSFILAMLQADTFGVSIAKVLRTQADEMRVKRRQMAQEEAQKAPVKMLIPMVFCIFPALFVVVLGPAVFDIIDAF